MLNKLELCIIFFHFAGKFELQTSSYSAFPITEIEKQEIIIPPSGRESFHRI